jgi:competence protein ComFC
VALRFWWDGLVELIWPPVQRCELCDAPGAAVFCPVCLSDLRRTDGVGAALQCAGQPFERLVCIGLHQGGLRKAVHRLKYCGRRRVAGALASMLAPRLAAAEGDLIVPVPLHAARLRERGYNQAELLADRLGELLGLPVVTGWVERTRPTEAQARLGRQERLVNVRDAFCLRRPGPVPWEGRCVWVVDDVLTTGATAGALTSLLLSAGAVSVGVAVAAVSASSPDA